MNGLEELRKKIDSIDSEIIELLAERMKIAAEIAKFKKENKLPAFQPERERLLFEELKKHARQSGINEGFVEELFKLVIDESKKEQEKIINAK